MPISIRSPAPTVFAASYRFPAKNEKPDTESWPWLRVPCAITESLCSTCSQLNISWLFSHSLYDCTVSNDSQISKLTDGICLGSYAHVSSRLTCSFCQLLVYALENGADIDMLNEFDDWPKREVYIMNYFYSESGLPMSPADKKGEYVVRIGVFLKSVDESNTLMNFGQRTVMIQKVCAEEVKPTLYSGRVVAQDTEQLVKRIQDWIRPCLEDATPTTLISARESTATIRLIDTQQSCVVGPLQNERYVALSYTWGKIDPLILKKDNESKLRQVDVFVTLRSRLPVTIRDAMSLCRMLGIRYLWVDSLCIMQDTMDKHDQIQQMDRIYREADLTIVAAVGKDANAGLPGVSGQRDIRQRIIEVDSTRLTNVIPSLGASIASSFWESRGWTFQESLLSTRKLVFTSDQTYYHCQHGECSQDTHSELHQAFDLAAGDVPMRFNIDNQSNWKIYRNVVAEYCKRYLSFEADVLNAFAGISELMSKSIFMGCPLVMGIPFCSMEVGLLWHPAERLRRRAGTRFPSWSWAGWVGMVEYPETVDYDNVFDRTISRVCWEFPTSPNDAMPESETGDVPTCMPPDSWPGWKDWKRIVVGEMDETYFVNKNYPPTRWFAHPLEQRTNWPVGAATSRLQLTAEIAELKLTGAHADLWYASEDCAEGNHSICRLQVFDHDGRKAGIAIMDGAAYEDTDFSANRSLFSFVRISQTTLSPGRDDPAWDVETKTFAGRPGERAINPQPDLKPEEEEFDQEEFDQEEFDRNVCWCLYNVLVVRFEGDIARRIAVGYVHIHAFDRAGAERRVFWLG